MRRRCLRGLSSQCCVNEEKINLYAIRSTIGPLATATGSLFTGLLVVAQGWGYIESIAYGMMFVGIGIPFLIEGVIKGVYDIAL